MFPHELAERADKENLSELDALVPPAPPMVTTQPLDWYINITIQRESFLRLCVCPHQLIQFRVRIVGTLGNVFKAHWGGHHRHWPEKNAA